MSSKNKNIRKWIGISLALVWMAAALLYGRANVHAEESEPKKAVTNILLIGSDHRDDSWLGNSDVMIVASVNEAEHKIVLTSFMRDLYADIPGYGVHKLNYAYPAGGAAALEETLADNYGLAIDQYAVVDFDSMASIIDAVGGVELTVSDDEANMINGYLYSMEKTEHNIEGGGTYELNGYQCVAHMRNRFVGDNDYQRTQRQRDVLSGIFDKAGKLGAEEMVNVAKELLTEIEHDLNPIELMEWMAKLPELTDYELIENRIPYDDLYYSQNEMLVPDFETTRARLHELIGD